MQCHRPRLQVLPAPLGRRRAARGFTLLELLVSIAIMMMLMAVMAGSLSSLTALDQRRAANEIATTLGRLHDEAILRNKTYRVTFDLDARQWSVEQSDDQVLIFDDATERESYEKDLLKKLKRASEEDMAALASREKFAAVPGGTTSGAQELPKDTQFVSVYTPEYEDPVKPRTEREVQAARADDPPRRASVHLFANGFAEPAVIQIGRISDAKDAYTVILDPLSGQVTLKNGLISVRDAFASYPERSPRLD